LAYDQNDSMPLIWQLPRANSFSPGCTRKCFLYPISTSPS